MLDDAGVAGADPKREQRNAKACAHGNDTFGYIGPLNSGAALFSEPILNSAALAQINPSNTDPILTSPKTRVGLQPATYSRRLAYLTYYRVVTTDALQAPADAAFLRETLHADTYFLVDDAYLYGRGLSTAFHAYGRKLGLRLVGSAHLDPRTSSTLTSSSNAISDLIVAGRPDAVFYGGDIEGGTLARDLRRKGYAGPLLGGDALLVPTFFTLAGSGLVNSYASTPSIDIAAASKPFRNAYRRRFHTPLQAFYAPAFDAANITLWAIYRAATHGTFRGSVFQMRAAILPYVARVRWSGATGLTSFDHNGDNRHRVVSMYRAQSGRWIFAGLAPKARGISSTG